MAVLFQALREKDASLDCSTPGKDPLSGFGHIAHFLKGLDSLFFWNLQNLKGLILLGGYKFGRTHLSFTGNCYHSGILSFGTLADIFFGKALIRTHLSHGCKYGCFILNFYSAVFWLINNIAC